MLSHIRTRVLAIIADLREKGDANAALTKADELVKFMTEAEAGPELVGQARTYYANDDINIDDDAWQSEGDDGVWVEAWVWLARSDDDA